MLTKAEAKDLINDVFGEEALVLGGLVALHEIEDGMRRLRECDESGVWPTGYEDVKEFPNRL